jgi:hypothetical protein
MTARTFGTFCLAAFLWLAGLTASPASASPRAMRGAAELALHALRSTPALATRAPNIAPAIQQLGAERHGQPGPSASPVLGARAFAWRAEGRWSSVPQPRVAHAGRALWRVYDANAPPQALAFQS